MIKATVKTFNTFPRVTQRVRDASRVALNAAARTAASTAQENASLDLQITVVETGGDLEGYSAGIISHRQSDTEGKTTPIGELFSSGTLGKRKRRLKQPGRRKDSWTQRNPGSDETHTATRGDVTGKGIEPQNFFPTARKVGRRKLKQTLAEELGKPLK